MPKPSMVGLCWLLAQHSTVLHFASAALAAAMHFLLLPNCEGTHSVHLFDLHSLERAESMMLRWMFGVSLKDRKRSEVL